MRWEGIRHSGAGNGLHDPDGRQDWQPEENLMQGRERIIRTWTEEHPEVDMKGDNEKADEFRCARCNRLDFSSALERDTHAHTGRLARERRNFSAED